jgi:gamma-glutamyltranspeptidase/glutathione hydrolase
MANAASTDRGAVAAGHPLTAEAGAEMLRQGGNAFDAAIAAAFTACVTESVLTSLAGGGFLLAHTAEGNNHLFDFFCQTPQSKTIMGKLDFYPIEANFGDAVQEFHVGLGSMAVPGVLAGLLDVHQRFGRLPLGKILAPARYWAIYGTRIEPFRAYCFQILAPILMAAPAAKAIYAPRGTLLSQGDPFYLPEFATVLDDLATVGADLLYQGELAELLIHDCRQQGGYLRQADLQDYQVIERQPLAVEYRGSTLLTNPPPSSGGTLIAFAIELLKDIGPGQYPFGSPGHIAALRETMRQTNLARSDGYDRRLYQPDVAERFLQENHTDLYRQQLFQALNKWGSTTHISAVDGEGNAVSMTTSNGEGSSYIIPGTGIMMNNMLGEEDLNPHGFHQWQPNQRISSMMAPTIVLQEGKPRLVLGSGGSNRIRTAILQVMSNVLDFGMDIATAVQVPRIHWERGAFHAEPGLDRAEYEVQGIVADDACTWWQQPNMFFGGVHAVAVTPEGDFAGVGDHRRGGAWVRV